MIEQFNHTNPILLHRNSLKLEQIILQSTAATTPLSPLQSLNQHHSDKQNQNKHTNDETKSRVCLIVIQEKVKQINFDRQKKQKSGFDRVLALLKEQRHAITKIKEQKRRFLPSMWRNLGTLMVLEKQKFQSDFMCQANNRNKQQLYNQLMNKNSNNIKSCQSFSKKIEQKSSQDKLKLHDLSINVESPERTDQRQANYQHAFKDATNKNNMQTKFFSLSNSKPIQFQKIEKTSRVMIRSRPVPYRLASNRSNLDGQNDEIKAKVESAFKSIKRNENFGKNILTSIVFDPKNVFNSQKRKYYFKNLQKRQFLRQDKQDQSAKVLLKVGGIKLAIQDNKRYKTLEIQHY